MTDRRTPPREQARTPRRRTGDLGVDRLEGMEAGQSLLKYRPPVCPWQGVVARIGRRDVTASRATLPKFRATSDDSCSIRVPAHMTRRYADHWEPAIPSVTMRSRVASHDVDLVSSTCAFSAATTSWSTCPSTSGGKWRSRRPATNLEWRISTVACELGRVPQRRRLGNHGRLVSIRGLRAFVRASSHSSRDRTPMSLMIVGSPMWRQRGPQPWRG